MSIASIARLDLIGLDLDPLLILLSIYVWCCTWCILCPYNPITLFGASLDISTYINKPLKIFTKLFVKIILYTTFLFYFVNVFLIKVNLRIDSQYFYQQNKIKTIVYSIFYFRIREDNCHSFLSLFLSSPSWHDIAILFSFYFGWGKAH